MLRENERLEKSLNNGEKIEKSVSEIYYENYLISKLISETETKLSEMQMSAKDPIFVGFLFEFYKNVIWKKDLMKLFANQRHFKIPTNGK